MCKEILELSERLSTDMEKAKHYHERVGEGEKFSFTDEIVPFVDDVQARAEEWRASVQGLLSEDTLGVLHPNQVEHTYENMYVLVTESFQYHVQEQRYQERLQAVDYILNLLQQEIEEKQ
ncbi:hypothetical protein HNR44_001026 [Geomicrobium halophilum]|uniref:DUF1798 domain-containing protein n=1 Tax=Geomicrobium halophilum TaxID=549000 RepID=A0A841PJN3_9BACL|nr:DUF1798 family protein [Geomicrobium halophilum]MBB6449077.1 hypothetical protein [Geomicrobium halophilum]